MGKVRDWFDSFGVFDPILTSSSEAAQEGAQQEGLDAWRDVIGAGPSTNELMGLDPSMISQEEVDAYLAERADGEGGLGWSRGGGGLTGGSGPMAQQAAREALLRERMASDQYFGLNQYERPELGDVAADPRDLEAQRRALGSFRDIYDAGGYTGAERAQFQLAQRDAALDERSQRLAIEQNAAARGIGGSGLEMMGVLGAQQGAANRLSDAQNMQTIAGQQRALQALQAYGSMAGDMRSQGFNEASTRANALDAWNRGNVDLRNQWTQRRGDAAQQGYQNLVTGTAGLTGQLGNYGSYMEGRENEARDQRIEGVNTAANFIGAYAGGGSGGGGSGGSASRNTGAGGVDIDRDEEG